MRSGWGIALSKSLFEDIEEDSGQAAFPILPQNGTSGTWKGKASNRVDMLDKSGARAQQRDLHATIPCRLRQGMAPRPPLRLAAAHTLRGTHQRGCRFGKTPQPASIRKLFLLAIVVLAGNPAFAPAYVWSLGPARAFHNAATRAY